VSGAKGCPLAAPNAVIYTLRLPFKCLHTSAKRQSDCGKNSRLYPLQS
jgi:hypothetical protein